MDAPSDSAVYEVVVVIVCVCTVHHACGIGVIPSPYYIRQISVCITVVYRRNFIYICKVTPARRVGLIIYGDFICIVDISAVFIRINTENILFICGGAFPDLEGIIKERLTKQAAIGFGADLKDKYNKDKTLLSKVTTEDLRNFGMIPEFLGRLPIVFTLDALSEDMMVKILKEPRNAILKQYQKLLALDEVQLEFTDDALLSIARKAMEKDTGARALRAIIE